MNKYLNKKRNILYRNKMKSDKFYQQISLEPKILKKFMKNGIELIIIKIN